MSGEVLDFPCISREPRRSFGQRKPGDPRALGAGPALRDALPWLLGNEGRISAADQAAKAASDVPAAIEDASDLADALTVKLRALARAGGKAKFHLLAQDAEQLSERLAHALAEVTP